MTTCGGALIVCFAIWMVFHHSQMSLTVGLSSFFTWFLSGFSWSWFLEGNIYPGPRAIHSKYSPYVVRKVLKTYAKFQKNMHLVLRKPLEEISDIPILAIHFEWMKWYIHLLKHPSSLYQVYSDCRLLKVSCLLKKPKPTTINCFLETLRWTWGEERNQEKNPLPVLKKHFLLPTNDHAHEEAWGDLCCCSHPAAETKTPWVSTNGLAGQTTELKKTEYIKEYTS